eukprot:jgi/Bigna1/68477/fgenesh1_pg.6_\
MPSVLLIPFWLSALASIHSSNARARPSFSIGGAALRGTGGSGGCGRRKGGDIKGTIVYKRGTIAGVAAFTAAGYFLPKWYFDRSTRGIQQLEQEFQRQRASTSGSGGGDSATALSSAGRDGGGEGGVLLATNQTTTASNRTEESVEVGATGRKDTQEVGKAFEELSYKEQRRISGLLARCKKGDIEAAYQLAVAHDLGYGVKHSPLTAFVLFRNCSRAGHVAATYDYGSVLDVQFIGVRYLLFGIGPALDEMQGIQHIMHAAYEGYVPAQVLYGWAIESHASLVHPGESAVEWYDRAMKQGYPDAYYHMGRLHREGKLVPKDAEKAMHFMSKAAQAGVIDANFELGVMFRDGEGGLAKDPVKAARRFEQAARQGHPGAAYHLGLSYMDGNGVKQDLSEAMWWFMKAGHKPRAFDLDEYSQNAATAASE